MGRLIDADVFKERLMANIGLTNCLDRSFKETPTIDAVPRDFHDKTCEVMAKRHLEELEKYRMRRQTMSDLIERSEVLKQLRLNHKDVVYIDKNECARRIEAIPSARPKGEWIRTFDGNEWFWYCSNCKTQYYEEDLWMGGNEFPYYCPNCGADMREREGE